VWSTRLSLSLALFDSTNPKFENGRALQARYFVERFMFRRYNSHAAEMESESQFPKAIAAVGLCRQVYSA